MLKAATFMVNTASMAKLKAVAKTRDLSVSALLRIAVVDFLRRNRLPSER